MRELWDEAIIFPHSDFNDYVQKNWNLFLSSKITKTVVKSDGLHIHQKEKNKYYINSSFIFQTLEKKEEKTTLFCEYEVRSSIIPSKCVEVLLYRVSDLEKKSFMAKDTEETYFCILELCMLVVRLK